MNKIFKNFLRENSSGITKFHLYKDIFIVLIIYIYNYEFIYNSIFYTISVYFIINYSLRKIYKSYRTLPFYKIFYKLIYRSLVISGTILFINASTSKGLEISLNNKEDLLIRSLFALFYILFSNIITRYFLRIYRVKGGNSRTILFWGSKIIFEKLKNELKNNTWMGLNLVAWFSPIQEEINEYPEICNGGILELEEWLSKNTVDQIIFTSENKNNNLDNLIRIFGNTSIPIAYIPDWYDSIMNLEIIDFGSKKIIAIWNTNKPLLTILIKRLMDFFISLFLIFILSPLLITIALLISLNTRKYFLYTQSRCGVNGKPFKIFKFRTMNVNESGKNEILKQASKNDPRITKIGLILRILSLDELPQLFNVLIGNMSLVGPRPHAISHNEFYRTKIKGYMQRHSFKPGITGLAQINGLRGGTKTILDMNKRIKADLEYINNWSLLLDIKILIKTAYKGWINFEK